MSGPPYGGWWREILNSDVELYGGSGVGNAGGEQGGRSRGTAARISLNVTLPPLAMLVFKPQMKIA